MEGKDYGCLLAPSQGMQLEEISKLLSERNKELDRLKSNCLKKIKGIEFDPSNEHEDALALVECAEAQSFTNTLKEYNEARKEARALLDAQQYQALQAASTKAAQLKASLRDQFEEVKQQCIAALESPGLHLKVTSIEFGFGSNEPQIVGRVSHLYHCAFSFAMFETLDRRSLLSLETFYHRTRHRLPVWSPSVRRF